MIMAKNGNTPRRNFQVNDYGETSVYKCDCGQLVPKVEDTPKTDWRDGSTARSAKTKSKHFISK